MALYSLNGKTSVNGVFFVTWFLCVSHLCQTQCLKLFYFNAFLFSNLIEGMCRVLYRSWWIMRSDQWVHLQTGTGERRVRRKLSGWHHLDYELHDLVNCLLIINNVLFVYGSCMRHTVVRPLHFDPHKSGTCWWQNFNTWPIERLSSSSENFVKNSW